MRLLLSYFILFVACTYAQEREDGIIYNHTSIGVKIWSPELTMMTYGFPNPAPHDLVQTWRYVVRDSPHQSGAFKLVCKKLYLPKAPGRNDCGNYKMTLEERGRITKQFCGDYRPFVYISETDDVKFELHTGANGGALVDCTARAIPVDHNRNEITTTTTTTTTTPRPTMPAYLKLESEEVDSSEDGGEEGPKGTTCPCGWANKATSRIINGTVTERNEFPFVAGLIFRGTRGAFCGSTIITRYHALTATHCTAGKNAKDLSIVAGIHNIYNDWDSPEYPIERIIDHNYTRGTSENDISLLVLEKEIEYNQFVGPACLPPAGPRLQLDRQYVKTIGWGREDRVGQMSTFLRKVNVRVVPMKECNFMFRIVNADNPTQICTHAKQKSACFGDSGGPIVWLDPETNRYTHIGINSFVMTCADDYPTVHTAVQYYLDWIQYQIRESRKPSSYTCTKQN